MFGPSDLISAASVRMSKTALLFANGDPVCSVRVLGTWVCGARAASVETSAAISASVVPSTSTSNAPNPVASRAVLAVTRGLARAPGPGCAEARAASGGSFHPSESRASETGSGGAVMGTRTRPTRWRCGALGDRVSGGIVGRPRRLRLRTGALSPSVSRVRSNSSRSDMCVLRCYHSF